MAASNYSDDLQDARGIPYWTGCLANLDSLLDEALTGVTRSHTPTADAILGKNYAQAVLAIRRRQRASASQANASPDTQALDAAVGSVRRHHVVRSPAAAAAPGQRLGGEDTPLWGGGAQERQLHAGR